MKTPKTPFSTRLSGSAKETELRIRNIFQWKKKRPPVVLFLAVVLAVLSCFGLFSCQMHESPKDDPAAEVTKPADNFEGKTEQDAGKTEETDAQSGEQQSEEAITEYFSRKLSEISPDTPLVITERKSFDWNGATVIAATATNIEVVDPDAPLLSADGPHREPNVPEAENTVMYLMSALFIDGQEPIDLMQDEIHAISKEPLGIVATGVSYDYGKKVSFQQFLSVVQYKTGDVLTVCPVFCDHGGELLLRDLKYHPVYSLEDADGDGEAEFVFFRERSSSLYSEFAVYDRVDGVVRRITNVSDEYKSAADLQAPSQTEVSLEDLLTEADHARAVPEFLTAEQQMLYRKANNLYRHAFGAATASVEYREVPWSGSTESGPENLIRDGRTYTRADGPLSRWSDFDEAVHSVFTDTFFWNRNGVPIYIEQEGTLYFLDIGRGCGYYYNEYFPDEFRLVSQTDTAVEFMLIGHYSQIWPNEGETTRERNERLKGGYEYTYEFPISMVLTEEGWRFDRFYSALTDEVGPETVLKKNSDALSACRAVLQNKTEFVNTESGERTTFERLCQTMFDGKREANVTPTHFAVADLDADGVPEVVVQINVYATCKYLILHEKEGEVYGYTRSLRGLTELKADGTFGWSNGAFDNGFGRVRFEEYTYTYDGRTIRESHTLDRITYCQSNGYDEDGNWQGIRVADRQPATLQEYDAAVARQSAKPDAVWYELTDENINAQLDD